MNTSTAIAWRGKTATRESLKLLKQQLGELAVSLSVWDHLGELSETFEPATEFCRTVRDAEPACLNTARTLARRIVESGAASRLATPCGGFAVGVPIFRRRRLMGAAVACFPVQSSLEEESLARLCDRLHLDRTLVTQMAAGVRGHSESEADHYVKILQWLLERDHVAQTAQDELGTLSANLAMTYEELSLLYRLSGRMSVTARSREFLDNLCRELREVANLELVAALLYAHPVDEHEETLVIAGDAGVAAGPLRLLLTTQIIPRMVQGSAARLDNAVKVEGELSSTVRLRNIIVVPLMKGQEVIGAIAGLNKVGGDFDSVDQKLLTSVGSQASVFLTNRRLYDDLQDLLMGVLNALTASIDAKDPYTCGHSQRVAFLSCRLAKACGFDAQRLERVNLCGLLHDIGKIGIPESILCKKGKLTDEEYARMKEHPELAASILRGIRRLDDIVVGVRSHHERYDGRGYPRGLCGEQIPIEGRIVGLADCLDAMTSSRTYRLALPLSQVIEEIRRNAGTQFDPTLVAILLSWDLEAVLAEARQVAKSVLKNQDPQEARA